MSQTLNCDCGCNKTTKEDGDGGWLVLLQIAGAGNSDPKLEETLHFADMSHLVRWSGMAAKIIPRLQRHALEVYPHGELRDEQLPGVYI